MAISVVKLLSEWQLQVGEATGQVGTRKYHEIGGGYSGGGEVVELPSIGDPWDDDEFKNCLCRSIRITYDGGSEDCGRFFTLEYSSARSDDSQYRVNKGEPPPTYGLLPVQMDLGMDVASWTDSGNVRHWKWNSDSSNIDQALFKNVGTATIQLTRILAVADIPTFIAASFGLVGLLNISAFFGFPKGMVLYQGASLADFYDENGDRKFRAVLSFGVKQTTQTFADGTDGWNWILRDDKGTWDAPVKVLSPTEGLYGFDADNFSVLFEVGQPGYAKPDLTDATE
jgi:hypothetical protein